MTKPSTTKQTVRLYWNHAWRYPIYATGTMLSIPFATLCSFYLPPIIIASVLNRLANGQFQSGDVWGSFGPSLVAFVGLEVIGNFSWRLVDAFMWRLESRVEQDLAEEVYDHLLDQSANFHANSFGGALVSQTNKLLGAYVRIADTSVFAVAPLIWGIIFSALILFNRTPLFVIFFVIFSLIYMTSAVFITKHFRHLSTKHAASESDVTAYLADSVTNVMAIKSFAGGQFERRQFHLLTEKTRIALRTLGRAAQKQMAYYSAMSAIVQSLALILGVVAVVNFDANIATIFLVLNYTANISGQLFNFSTNVLRNYNRAFGDAAEMTQTLQLDQEVKDPVNPQKLKVGEGALKFDKVAFTHDGSSDAIFRNLNLDIKAGEKIGLVGHSGSGKTTLTRILLRFSDIDAGEILIDDQNIAKLSQNDLHQLIAYVPQEPIMFHRSLLENIRYGDFQSKQSAVLAAAKAAHADEFIKELPEKYETMVGERGVKLSGGQRQRIAIARAMLKNAPILVLDEATSALDSESESLIQDALWKLMEGRTAIAIAHRLSTVQKMDRIIVLDKGEVVEEGTHKELLKRKGIYANLWAHQSGGFLED